MLSISKLFSNFSLSDFYKWLLASMAKKSKFLSWLGFGKSDEKQTKETNNQQTLAEQQETERLEQACVEAEKAEVERLEQAR
ncbi:cell division protein FtsY, partial [Pseudoalteromonas sp. S558]